MASIDPTIELANIDGTLRTLADFDGKVLLVVNTASACGYTPQFEGLQKLWVQYEPDGLVVLGFPCNQFGDQDPGTNDEILSFCQVGYGVTFPMFAKIEVNGGNAHPLFEQLKIAAPGLLGSKGIKWNFTKFLVARDGTVLGRFGPRDTPDSLRSAIQAALT